MNPVGYGFDQGRVDAAFLVCGHDREGRQAMERGSLSRVISGKRIR
jgi:hypothetical protein